MTNCYQAEADSHAAKLQAMPIAHALLDLLWQASRDFDRTEAQRTALSVRAIGVSAEIAGTWRDFTQDQAMQEMISAGLAPAGTEPYGVFVDGQRVGGILAKNVHHARNKAKKEFGLHVAEYRRVGDEHQIHGARLAAHDDARGAADIARIMRQDAESERCRCGARAPFTECVCHVAPKAEHVAGVERRAGETYNVRATCSCGWRGIWHRTEPMTRTSARAHREAHGGRA